MAVDVTGDEVTRLNEALVKRQGLSDVQVLRIQDLHGERRALFNEMKLKDRADRSLADDAKALRQIEFSLQEAWGFDQDENFHSWWFQAPHCRCPKLDNADRIGTKYHIYADDCPLHGSQASMEAEQKDTAERNVRWDDKE